MESGDPASMIAASIVVLILAGLVRAAVGAGAQASHVSRGWAYPLMAALCVTAGPLGHLVMAAHGNLLSTTSWAESGILLGNYHLDVVRHYW